MRTPFENTRGKVNLVIYTMPYPCGGKCRFCFDVDGYPGGFIENEDTIRARDCGWSSSQQLQRILNSYGLRKNSGLKCDVTILGGSFTNYPRDYLTNFVKEVFDWVNSAKSADLEESKSLQDESPDKLVVLSVETRPDLIDEESCRFLVGLGVTLVELGAQSLDDDVLNICGREYDSQQVAKATHLLREHGLKVGYHVMVGLPGSTVEGDVDLLSHRLWSAPFFPDFLKIYPCVMLVDGFGRNSDLHRRFPQWTAYSNDLLFDVLLRSKRFFPQAIKVSRIQRILPRNLVALGPDAELDRRRFDGICRCITHRAVGWVRASVLGDFSDFEVRTNNVPHGWFVEACAVDGSLLGYARIGRSSDPTRVFLREIRTFGEMASLGSTSTLARSVQHVGIGKALLGVAEKKAVAESATTMMVNAGVGARGYFSRRGYVLSGDYMVKAIV